MSLRIGAGKNCSILKFDAKADDGSIVHWAAETNNPADMVEKGWTAKSIKVGDEVTVTLHQVKNGLPVGNPRASDAFGWKNALDTQYLKSN